MYTCTSRYVWYIYIPERVHDGVNTGGLKCTNIETFICDGDLVLGRNPFARKRSECAWDRSDLCSNDESSHISAGTSCYATEPS